MVVLTCKYCEFGGSLTKCKAWLESEHEDLYNKLYSAGLPPPNPVSLSAHFLISSGMKLISRGPRIQNRLPNNLHRRRSQIDQRPPQKRSQTSRQGIQTRSRKSCHTGHYKTYRAR